MLIFERKKEQLVLLTKAAKVTRPQLDSHVCQIDHVTEPVQASPVHKHVPVLQLPKDAAKDQHKKIVDDGKANDASPDVVHGGRRVDHVIVENSVGDVHNYVYVF